MTWLLRWTTQALQSLQRALSKTKATHLLTGRLGETEAYLHLRERGYCIVAHNYRATHNRGEIDLIGWDGDVLCFIEVKTRTGQGLTPAEAAVDTAKQDHVRSVARAYLRRLPADRYPPCRFDIVSVTFPETDGRPEIKLIKGAFRWKRQAARRGGWFVSSTRRGPWPSRR
jgi:putative endonuclease